MSDTYGVFERLTALMCDVKHSAVCSTCEGPPLEQSFTAAPSAAFQEKKGSLPMPEQTQSPEVIRSIQRGFDVIKTFTPSHPQMNLSQVAERTGLSRGTARRVLLTLEELGYARLGGRMYSLTSKVLELGYSYLSSINPWDAAFPLMNDLSDRLGENCLAGVREGIEIVCVARTSRRLAAVAVYIGGRIPAFASSIGRVLLGDATPQELQDYFHSVKLRAATPYTVTDESVIRADLERVRKQGWSIVENELEEGLIGVAAPVYATNGRVVAALNVSAHGNRVSYQQVMEEFLPPLLDSAHQVSEIFRRRLVSNAARPMNST